MEIRKTQSGIQTEETLIKDIQIREILEKLSGGERVTLASESAEDTAALGALLGRAASPGQIYTLTGDLGVGKTVFTQGFAKGLGVAGPVNSPTFTIVQIYEDGRLPFYHFDVYRIADVEEMEEIGYEDCFYGAGVCLIEWAELIEEILPENTVQVIIEKDLEKGFDYRRISLTRT
mgnify:CR=1 FL=1